WGLRPGPPWRDGTQPQGILVRNPRAFLYQTARNLAIDYYRKKSKTVFLENDLREDGNVYDDAVVDDISKIAKKFDLEKDVSRVQKILLQLRDEYAEVVILRYIEEMSFLEISEIVGKPEGTIRVILHRAINELRENLAL
ncbi:MAG: RNA polymerase sigma factor, partial [Patescibacteria group bacterium]